jgi:hypothetical protein
MVDDFAESILNTEDLAFGNYTNSQIQSLYDPGHVETWSAVTEKEKYQIVVDLDLGAVVFYSRDPMVDVSLESSSGKNFTHFPDVPDITDFMEIPIDDVVVLTDSEDEMVLGFYETDFDYHDKTLLSTGSYIRLLESVGYESEFYDGTVVGGCELENGKYLIRITWFMSDAPDDLKEFKENRTNIKNIDLISDKQNVLFEIRKLD